MRDKRKFCDLTGLALEYRWRSSARCRCLSPRWSRHVVSPHRPYLAPAARPGPGRRQGEGRGPRSVGVGAGDGRQGRGASGPECRCALRPGLSRQDRNGLAGDGGLGRRLPLRDPLLPRRQAGALRAWRRRSFPDFGGAGATGDRAGRSGRQGADHRHRARRELLSLEPPRPGHRGHRRGLQCAELGAGGEFQHRLRRAQRRHGALRREAELRSPRSRSRSSGREAPREADASA